MVHTIDKEHFLNTYENDCITKLYHSPVNIHDNNGRKCVAARLVVDHRNKLVRVIATKTIAAHSEILMSYGRKFKLNYLTNIIIKFHFVLLSWL